MQQQYLSTWRWSVRLISIRAGFPIARELLELTLLWEARIESCRLGFLLSWFGAERSIMCEARKWAGGPGLLASWELTGDAPIRAAQQRLLGTGTGALRERFRALSARHRGARQFVELAKLRAGQQQPLILRSHQAHSFYRGYQDDALV